MLWGANLPSIDQPPALALLTQNQPCAQPRARPPLSSATWKIQWQLLLRRESRTYLEGGRGMQIMSVDSLVSPLSAVKTKAGRVVFPRLSLFIFFCHSHTCSKPTERSNPHHRQVPFTPRPHPWWKVGKQIPHVTRQGQKMPEEVKYYSWKEKHQCLLVCVWHYSKNFVQMNSLIQELQR